jgi:hypothetical protein
MLQIIKRFFMGLANRNEKVEQNNNPIPPIPPFSKEELEFLLKLVSDCTFKGKEVQVVYDLVYKLQQLYIK